MIPWRPRSVRPSFLSVHLPPPRRVGVGRSPVVSPISHDGLFGSNDLDPDSEGPSVCRAEGAHANHMT
jgi:hypothetical protein